MAVLGHQLLCLEYMSLSEKKGEVRDLAKDQEKSSIELVKGASPLY